MRKKPTNLFPLHCYVVDFYCFELQKVAAERKDKTICHTCLGLIKIGLIWKAQYTIEWDDEGWWKWNWNEKTELKWNEMRSAEFEVKSMWSICQMWSNSSHIFRWIECCRVRKFHIKLQCNTMRTLWHVWCIAYIVCVCTHTWQTIKHHTPTCRCLSLDGQLSCKNSLSVVRIVCDWSIVVCAYENRIHTHSHTSEYMRIDPFSFENQVHEHAPVVHMLALCNNLVAWQIVCIVMRIDARNERKNKNRNENNNKKRSTRTESNEWWREKKTTEK